MNSYAAAKRVSEARERGFCVNREGLDAQMAQS